MGKEKKPQVREPLSRDRVLTQALQMADESGIEALKGLRVTLQGQNLTDEPTIQANPGDGRQITQYETYGRNFLLGFNYTF